MSQEELRRTEKRYEELRTIETPKTVKENEKRSFSNFNIWWCSHDLGMGFPRVSCVFPHAVPGEVEKEVTPLLTRISMTVIIFHSISLFKLFIYSKLFVLISTAPVADQRSVSTSKVSASASRAWTTTGRLWSTSKWRLGQGHIDNEYNLFTFTL